MHQVGLVSARARWQRLCQYIFIVLSRVQNGFLSWQVFLGDVTILVEGVAMLGSWSIRLEIPLIYLAAKLILVLFKSSLGAIIAVFGPLDLPIFVRGINMILSIHVATAIPCLGVERVVLGGDVVVWRAAILITLGESLLHNEVVVKKTDLF